MRLSEVNHLRRLLAWVRCEIGQAPEEMVETLRDMTGKLGWKEGDFDEAAKARLVQAHDAARSVPGYVRAAVKALEKTLEQGPVVPECDSALTGPATDKADGWIPISLSLPPEREQVLLLEQRGANYCQIVGWSRGDTFFAHGTTTQLRRLGRITHWHRLLPLPEGLVFGNQNPPDHRRDTNDGC